MPACRARSRAYPQVRPCESGWPAESAILIAETVCRQPRTRLARIHIPPFLTCQLHNCCVMLCGIGHAERGAERHSMRLNISVPDTLADEVRRLRLPVSAICQRALNVEVGRRLSTEDSALEQVIADLRACLERLESVSAAGQGEEAR
jgi:post-segregation antitoxin (ccd killing protein)